MENFEEWEYMFKWTMQQIQDFWSISSGGNVSEFFELWTLFRIGAFWAGQILIYIAQAIQLF